MSTRLSTRDSGTALSIPIGSTTGRIDTGFHPTITSPFSISCWIKPKSYKTGANNESSIWGVEAASAAGVFLHMNSNAGDTKTVNYSGSVAYTAGSIKLELNEWYNVVFTYDGTTVKTYINSVLDINVAKTLVDVANNLLLMARTSTVSAYRPFSGSADEYRLWNYALSATEVSSLYFNNVVPRNGLVGEWLFNEASGTTALDTSGNANNGTITGATYTTDVPFKPRMATTNRTAVQPMNASLNFSVSTDKVDCGTAITGLNTTASFSVWFKPFKNGSTQTIFSNVVSASNRIGLIIHSNGELSAGFYNGSSYTGKVSSVFRVDDTMWRFVSITWDGSTMTMRINGVVAAGANQPILQSTAGIVIGLDTAGTSPYKGKLKDLKIFNRILTTTEQDALMSGINPTDYSTSIVRDFSLNEGAGTTVYSKNNTSLTGTITGATWSSNTPTKTRNQVGGNLVKNGDLSYIPQVNVAQTTTARWIDGTAAGSTTNSLFGCSFAADANNASAMIDTVTKYNDEPSFKVSTLDATGRSRITLGAIFTGATVTEANRGDKPIKVKGSTQYTLTYMVKTNNAAANSVYMSIHQHDANGTRLTTSNSPTKLSGTNDWTLVTDTFTSEVNTRFLNLLIQNTVAGNISDAWFADIKLTPTVNTTRASI